MMVAEKLYAGRLVFVDEMGANTLRWRSPTPGHGAERGLATYNSLR
jgi:hypothetical protein